MNAATIGRDPLQGARSISAKIGMNRIAAGMSRPMRLFAGILKIPSLAGFKKCAFVGVLAVVLILFEKLAPGIAILALAYAVWSRSDHKSTGRRPWGGTIPQVRSGHAGNNNDVPLEAEKLADVIPLNNSFAPAWQDVDDFLKSTLDVIKTRFAFQTANIFLRGDDKSSLVQRAFVSYTDSVARLAVIKVGHGLVGWVAANKRPLVVGNLHHEGRSMGYYRASGERISSFAAAPIMAAGEVVGVISLDHSKPDAFASPDTEEALSAIAGLLARVLGAEEKMDSSGREADRIRESRRILRSAYESTNLDAAAAAALKELVTLTDFHSLACFLLDENGTPSRRASIGFHDIWANEVKAPIMMRAVTQALSQASPYRIESVALAAQYRSGNVHGGGHSSSAPHGAGQSRVIPEILLALPILHRGEPLGVLVVEMTDKKKMDDRIEGILSDVVNDFGGALLRVYRASTAEGTAKVEGELIKFSSSLLSVESTEQIWDKLFSLLLRKTNATAAVAYRRESRGFVIESVAGCTPTAEMVPLEEGLLGWTALASRPVIASRNDRRKPPMEEGESYLAFPIGDAKTPRSVIVLASTEKSAFTSENMEAVKDISNTVYPILQALDRLEEARSLLDVDAVTGLLNEDGFARRLGVMALASDVGVSLVRVDNLAALQAEYGRKEVRSFFKKIGNLLETTVGRAGAVARIEAGTFAIAVKGDISPIRQKFMDVMSAGSMANLLETRVIFRVASVSTTEKIPLNELVDAAESRLSASSARPSSKTQLRTAGGAA